MSAKIDLGKYINELEAFIRLSEDFVDKSSSLTLADIHRDLELHVTERRKQFSWKTPWPRSIQTRPLEPQDGHTCIRIRPSERYDGPNRKHRPTQLTVSFDFGFRLPKAAKPKALVWEVTRASTHFCLIKENRPYSFHFDLKNPEQWGPPLHFQVAEACCGLPIPRIPSAIYLPSDCLDLLLAELHPEEWYKTQNSGNNRNYVSAVRKAQEERIRELVNELQSHWESNRNITRIMSLQRNFTSGHARPIGRNQQ